MGSLLLSSSSSRFYYRFPTSCSSCEVMNSACPQHPVVQAPSGRRSGERRGPGSRGQALPVLTRVGGWAGGTRVLWLMVMCAYTRAILPLPLPFCPALSLSGPSSLPLFLFFPSPPLLSGFYLSHLPCPGLPSTFSASLMPSLHLSSQLPQCPSVLSPLPGVQSP